MGFNFTLVWGTGNSEEGGYVVLAEEESADTYFATVIIQGRIYATNSFGTSVEAINYVHENLQFFTKDVKE